MGSEHSKPAQTRLLLALLRQRGEHGITPIAALREIGSFRLGARIWELRAAGHIIETHRVRTDSGALIARYVLVEK